MSFPQVQPLQGLFQPKRLITDSITLKICTKYSMAFYIFTLLLMGGNYGMNESIVCSGMANLPQKFVDTACYHSIPFTTTK